MNLLVLSTNLQMIKNMQLSRNESRTARKKFFEKSFSDATKMKISNLKDSKREKHQFELANVRSKLSLHLNQKIEA